MLLLPRGSIFVVVAARSRVLVLYPAEMAKAGAPTPAATWRRWAADVSGRALPSGHLLPKESPALVLAEVGPFLRRAHS